MQIQCDERTVVAFDLDDTLYKEVEFVESGFSAVSRLFSSGRVREVEDRLHKLRLTDCRDPFREVAENFAESVSVSEMRSAYRLHMPALSLEFGAEGLLAAIRTTGARVALITDGRSRTQRNKIAALRLIQLLDVVVISEEIGSEKPSEKNYRCVERALPDTDDFYFIGDNPRKDFVAPNRLGWVTIQLRDDGRNIHDQHHVRDERFRAANEVLSLNEIDVVQAPCQEWK